MILKRDILSIAAVGLLIANQYLHAMVPIQINEKIPLVVTIPIDRPIDQQTSLNLAECVAGCAINFEKISRNEGSLPEGHLSFDKVRDLCRYALCIPANYADNVPSLTTSDGRLVRVREQLSQEEVDRYNLYARRENAIRYLTSRFVEDIDEYKEYSDCVRIQVEKIMRKKLKTLLED